MTYRSLVTGGRFVFMTSSNSLIIRLRPLYNCQTWKWQQFWRTTALDVPYLITNGLIGSQPVEGGVFTQREALTTAFLQLSKEQRDTRSHESEDMWVSSPELSIWAIMSSVMGQIKAPAEGWQRILIWIRGNGCQWRRRADSGICQMPCHSFSCGEP